MKCTSAEAAKILRKLKSDHAVLREKENKSSRFVAAVGEDVESVRPDYNYATVQEELQELERKMRVVKHAINVFNVTTIVPGTEMTVDQLLVYMPQLSERRQKLSEMACMLPKERQNSGYGNKMIIEYNYANFDIAKAKADLDDTDNEMAAIQTALDCLNNTAMLEIDL